MHSTFKLLIDSLEPLFQSLMDMNPVIVQNLPRDMPKAGNYLFSEGNSHLYVGRTNSLRKRLQTYCQPGSGHNSATFAFRLARKATGFLEATYARKGSRQHLQDDPRFGPVFVEQKARVRDMQVRYVEEEEQIRQALLEMYVAVSLKTPHNDFDNH
ncbi:MAG: hypothetical protein DHS20C01_32470 [marine bacterium B5-7]|nr:MAG: hypothetical protein DHS20C01_32470 [marine bacterium B5-7]